MKLNDWQNIGIVIGVKTRWQTIKDALEQFIQTVCSSDYQCEVKIINARGKQIWDRLIKEGMVEVVSTNHRFSDKAVENMMKSFDPVTNRMEITGEAVEKDEKRSSRAKKAKKTSRKEA